MARPRPMANRKVVRPVLDPVSIFNLASLYRRPQTKTGKFQIPFLETSKEPVRHPCISPSQPTTSPELQRVSAPLVNYRLYLNNSQQVMKIIWLINWLMEWVGEGEEVDGRVLAQGIPRTHLQTSKSRCLCLNSTYPCLSEHSATLFFIKEMFQSTDSWSEPRTIPTHWRCFKKKSKRLPDLMLDWLKKEHKRTF